MPNICTYFYASTFTSFLRDSCSLKRLIIQTPIIDIDVFDGLFLSWLQVQVYIVIWNQFQMGITSILTLIWSVFRQPNHFSLALLVGNIFSGFIVIIVVLLFPSTFSLIYNTPIGHISYRVRVSVNGEGGPCNYVLIVSGSESSVFLLLTVWDFALSLVILHWSQFNGHRYLFPKDSSNYSMIFNGRAAHTYVSILLSCIFNTFILYHQF